MGPSIQSGRRYPTRRSTVVVSCPLPPGVSFRDLQTSDSLRYAPNRFLTSSRAGRLPPSWSSPVGGLGGRLVHCWPTYVTGTRRKPVRTTTGPPSSERPPPSRKKWLNRPCTCYSILLRPLGARTHDSGWRATARSPWPGRVSRSVRSRPGRLDLQPSLGFAGTSSRCRPATLPEGGGRRELHAAGQSGDSVPLPTGGSV
ncbi:conserved hypothetical protein [Trichinella spiralis]|uniref:hypothetical protein n=2 Tax=Trichinella spiralis TaxID=6334 RepID=UPI0001EFEDA9|nr:conserved hypothetical protein [Trichinella spiralis]